MLKKLFVLLLVVLTSIQVSSQNNNRLLGEIEPAEFFQNYAMFAYDFTNLTGADGAAIANGNAGLQDISNNNRDATIVGTPLIEQLTINGTTENTLEDLGTNAVSIGSNGTGIYNRSSFRIYLVLYVTDGQPAATHNLLGGIIPTNRGLNVFLSSTGVIGVQYGNADGVTQWRTSSPAFQDGINGLVLLEIQADFDANTILVKYNGENTDTFEFSGDISIINPPNWTNTANIYVGALNNNGTVTTNATSNSILFAATTPYFISFDLDQSIDDYLYTRFFNWENEIHVTDESSANTLRSTLITEVFNGNGLPTATPTITTGYTGNMHICQSADITGWSSIDRYVYTMTDVDGFSWTNVVYRLYSSAASNGNLIFNIQGHISDSGPAHEGFMSQALAAGYDVAFAALVVASNDNTETNPTVTSQSTAGHDQIKSGGLDDGTYNPLELYLFDKISFINNVDASYTDIDVCGISGGGWCTTMLAAIDTRISNAVAVRGYMPRTFKDVLVNREGDYEQMGALFSATSLRTSTQLFNLGTTVSYMDLAAMATTGGRKFHSTNHREDDCCFKGLTYRTWVPAVSELAATWSGDFQHKTDMEESRLTHAYSTFDIAEIFDTFN